MITTIKKILGIGCALFVFPQGAFGQSLQQQGIANTTQILNTSILFAIGAREAEQALRGSFGWPTFQEGFVDRVYFRFDPDGYARFSTSPRLDEDVFEVICAESSTACLAKKPSLQIGLTVEGKIQIKIEDITPQDTFFVSDRKSELPLPPTILEPLDARLETLLASGGHLIIKRQVETIQEISLAGFSAVATYLRWVAQGQSPRVFPRGWPVPAQVNSSQVGGLTQADSWIAPNAGPQQGQTTFSQAQGYQNTLLQAGQLQPAQVGGVRGQIKPTGVINAGGIQGQQINQAIQFGPAQSIIQALEREIAQLRASQESASALTSGQIVDDVAIGFAQQAQARDLHTPVGFGSGILVPNEPQKIAAPSNDFTRADVQRDRSDLVGIDHQTLNALEARLFALESAIVEMRGVLLMEMRDIKTRPTEVVTAPDQVSTVPVAAQLEKSPESMEALEKLLLERLSQRDPLPTVVDTAVEPPAVPEAGLERAHIMDLLKQLEPEAVDEVSVIEEPAVQTVEDPSSGGFVTLSDYINQVLKSEGQTPQHAN